MKLHFSRKYVLFIVVEIDSSSEDNKQAQIINLHELIKRK